jgi:hypothetical protein
VGRAAVRAPETAPEPALNEKLFAAAKEAQEEQKSKKRKRAATRGNHHRARKRDGCEVAEIDCAFSGTLTRGADAKTSASGKDYVRLVVRIGGGDGAHFASVGAFNDLAEVGALEKGSRVYVEGALTLGVWNDRDGNPRPSLSVAAYRVVAQRIGRNRSRENKRPAKQLELGGLG